MHSGFRLESGQARELAATFGTPLYVVDEAHFRERIRRYRQALVDTFPSTQLCYASKANSALALIAIAHQEGCLIDVASEGEFRAALAAGVPAARCNFHGNNKSPGELRFACEQGIGEIIVDNLEEIERLGALKREGLTIPTLVLRLAPGVDPHTHEKISTGQEDSKFGLNIADCSARRGVEACLQHGLPLGGFHAHVGSQLLDPEAQCVSGERIGAFAVDMLERFGLRTEILNVGGGLGVRYLPEHDPLPIDAYVARVSKVVADALEGSGLTPTLMHEPGRALISDAAVTLYSIGNIKDVSLPGGAIKRYAAVDGGLFENPRPALYDAVYSCALMRESAAPLETFHLAGKHCETDNLFPAELPADLRPGDVIQVFCTGAYNASMASNYNRYPRPAMALLRQNGRCELIQRPETWDEMFAREIIPNDLQAQA
jgi:diaminopimelate decarboxylase